MAYAEGTSVPVERSRAEIESLLKKAGASGFMYGWDDARDEAHLACRLNGYTLQFRVKRPTLKDIPRDNGKTGRSYRTINDEQRKKMVDSEERRRWRALLLIIKAKLEVVEAKQSTFEREFLADIALPDGGTIADQLLPRLKKALEDGKMPRLLLGAGV